MLEERQTYEIAILQAKLQRNALNEVKLTNGCVLLFMLDDINRRFPSI